MKALRIKAFQETACYTRPFASKVGETYPLPPYSTVKGMIHAVMDAKELIPFTLSIQGDYETMMIDYRNTYFMKKKTVNMPIVFDGLACETPDFPDMTSMPLYSHMLYNIDLVIHVRADEEILKDMLSSFKRYGSHLSLGRQEDLLRLDEIKIVDLKTVDLYAGASLKHSMYIPSFMIQEDELSEGVPYLLNWTYEIKNGIREWHRIPSVYFTKGTFVSDDLLVQSAYCDEDDYIVIWNQ